MSSDSYDLKRDLNAACRLNLQALLWNESLGYLLHPSVAKACDAGGSLRIADIGTGTGIWPITLARSLVNPSDGSQGGDGAPRVRIDGFDINLSQCPPAEWVPGNISFRKWDAFTEPPSDAVEQYDVVHVRLFMINIRETAEVFVQNLWRLLKPGGWLQWEEINNLHNEILSTAPDRSTSAIQRCKDYNAVGSKRHIGSQDWLLSLPETLTRVGFTETEAYTHIDPPELTRYFFETWLQTFAEFTSHRLHDTEEGASNEKIYDDACRECRGGAVMRVGKMVYIASKPVQGDTRRRLATGA